MDEQTNPWQVLAEKPVYDNPWISVTEYDVINPSGGKGIYGKVGFKNLAIGILPLDDNLNTWLVGQYRFTIDAYSWEIPEGGGEKNIDPLVSAKRELLEETGLQAQHWRKLLDIHLSNSVSDEAGVSYLATGLSYHEAQPEETEKLVIQKLPFREVFEMVMDGRITDSLSMVTILKVQYLLQNGLI